MSVLRPIPCGCGAMACRGLLRAGFLLAGIAFHFVSGPAVAGETCAVQPSTPPATAIRVELVPLQAGLYGRLSFPAAPLSAASLPAVVLVGDSLGWDPRQERYVRRLLAHGLAVLELTGEDEASQDAMALRQADAFLACDPRIDPDRIGALGFGAGAALVLPVRRPRAMLYPGCASLRQRLPSLAGPALAGQGEGPVMLLHGTADPANTPEECAALAALLEETGPVRRIAYRGAGYAWDMPPYGAPHAMRLRRPDGAGWLPVAPWPELADFSAEQVAHFFFLALRAGG